MQSVSESIVSAFQNYLVNSRKSTGEFTPKEKKFYVSDIGKCYRMRWLKRKGISGEYGFETYYTFAHGDFIHQLGYKALESADMLVSTEQKFENEHFVGKYDGIVRHNNQEYMFDFKSTNPYVMKRIVSGAGDNIENILQVLTYVHFNLQEHKSLNDIGMLVYVNKLPSDKIEPTIIKPREYHYTTYKGEIIDDINKMIDFWLKDKIPPCTCPSWSMQKYNSFYLFCKMPEKEIRTHLAYMKAGNQITTNGYDINIVKPIGKEVEA